MTLAHYAWHRESDGWSFYIALDAEGRVLSAYAAEERAAPGTSIPWEACNELERLAADLAAGGWHPTGGHAVQWPPSIDEEGVPGHD